MPQPLRSLYRKINYTFEDEKLLMLALSHRSVGARSNERLEYLGDAVLSLVIADTLYNKFPRAREGQLSRLRAQLVKGETLAEMAKEFELGHYLHMGEGEMRSGGTARASILADAMEAIIGAMYLEAGFQRCYEVVGGWYASRIKNLDPKSTRKDPKTALQEYLQAKRFPLPEYTVANIRGQAHAQEFDVECRVNGVEFMTSGSSNSRRKAEQIAAAAFLEKLHDR